MKKLIITSMCLLWVFLSYGQDNYVKSYTARDTIKTSLKTISDKDRVLEAVEYLDGLGRPVQSVVREGSPGGNDVVSFFEYDDYGRSLKQYLPFVRQTMSGAYDTGAMALQKSFYQGLYNANQSNYAFSEAEVETSPLGRPLRQGSPGESWQLSGNNTVENQYRVNEASDEIRKLIILGDTILAESDYPAGELFVTITTDENTGVNEGESRVFTDKSGRTLVKKVKSESGFLSTVYVYDDYGNLRHVISPEGIRIITAGSVNWNLLNEENFRKNWVFSYQYDGRNRMIAKRVPGSDWMHMIYDNRDRLVLSQDGNQSEGNVERVDGELTIDRYKGKSYKLNSGAKLKINPGSGKFKFTSSTGNKFKVSFNDFANNQKWIFTKYDELNRPVATGFYFDSDPVDVVRAKVAAITDFEESFTGTGSMQGYDNSAFPANVLDENLLSITYYDDYEFDNDPTRPTVKGLPTGAKTRVLGTDSWLTSITYYDDRLRPISIVTDNHLDGQDIINTTYRNAISSVVLSSEMIHSSKYLDDPLKVVETYTYDHMDRLLTLDQQILEGNVNKGTKRIISNTYDQQGQLQTKSLNNGIQLIDYAYNIRGWLTKINDGDTLTGSDKFGMELKYDEAGHYNGNIGEMSWKTVGGVSNQNTQKFSYNYDPLSRLKSALYSSAGKNNHFNVSGITYDGNGNIKNLTRRKNGIILDSLLYQYIGSGNQLTNVDDYSHNIEGFKDSDTDIAPEYVYDANGNMIIDLNKGISNITYNHLNLPEIVSLDSGKFVRYLYDAAGIKLQKIAGNLDSGGNIVETTTDYVGGKHYTNGSLEFFQHAEGRIVKSTGGYAYEFNLTDHLGNVRASIDSAGNVIQRDDYYPFGLTFQSYTGTNPKNNYQYNGFEKQELTGWFDYQARYYDPELGRFLNVDPAADLMRRHSPYNYAFDNPIKFIDPDGMMPTACDPCDQESGGSFSESYDEGLKQGVVNQVNSYWDYAKSVWNSSGKILVKDGAKSLTGFLKLSGELLKGDVSSIKGAIQNTADSYKARIANSTDPAKELGTVTGEVITDAVVSAAAEKGLGTAAKLLKSSSVVDNFAKVVKNLPCGCFLASTKILTDNGEKDIVDIKSGDAVYAYDDQTGNIELKKVVNTFKKERNHIYRIYFGESVIEATNDHPFFIGGKWLIVGELSVGDKLTLYNGNKVKIDSITFEKGTFEVFNFEVEDYHTYYVSSSNVLVHNSGPCDFLQTSSIRKWEVKSAPEELAKIDNIRESIRLDGIGSLAPIEVFQFNGKNLLVDGHHRLAAALEEGASNIPVRFLTRDQFNVAAKRMGRFSTPQALEALVELKKNQPNVIR